MVSFQVLPGGSDPNSEEEEEEEKNLPSLSD